MNQLTPVTASEARKRFTEFQQRMLDHYGIRASDRYLGLANLKCEFTYSRPVPANPP